MKVDGYLIDPYSANVTSLRVERGSSKGIFKALQCDRFRVGGYLPTGDVIYVEDVDLLSEHTNHFRIPSASSYPLAGRGVVIGTSDEEGLATSAKIDADGLVGLIYWVYDLDRNGASTFEVKATTQWSLNKEEVAV